MIYKSHLQGATIHWLDISTAQNYMASKRKVQFVYVVANKDGSTYTGQSYNNLSRMSDNICKNKAFHDSDVLLIELASMERHIQKGLESFLINEIRQSKLFTSKNSPRVPSVKTINLDIRDLSYQEFFLCQKINKEINLLLHWYFDRPELVKISRGNNSFFNFNGEYVVVAGDQVLAQKPSLSSSYKQLSQYRPTVLDNTGIVLRTQFFSSPSIALSFIYGSPQNGYLVD